MVNIGNFSRNIVYETGQSTDLIYWFHLYALYSGIALMTMDIKLNNISSFP